MKDLFQSKKKDEDEENMAQNYYKKFTNQGPAYFGDLDETDGKLLEFERAAEDEGESCSVLVAFPVNIISPKTKTEWEDAYAHVRRALSMPEDDPVPKLSRPAQGSTLTITDQANGTDGTPPPSKRKADADVDMDDASAAAAAPSSKRPHVDGKTNGAPSSANDAAVLHAHTTAAYIPFLSPGDLLPPKMPSVQEMEQFLLDLRKKALVEEYFGDS